MNKSEQLLKIEIRSQRRLVSSVEVAVNRLAEELGLSSEESVPLAEAVGEACRNAILHAFDGSEAGTVEISADLQGRRLAFTVSDKGLPFDGALLEQTGRGGTGNELMHRAADSVKVKNLGTGGMELLLTKALPLSPSDELEAPASEGSAEADLTYRMLGPDDSLAISRCTYRTYGYTYAEEVYHPEIVAQGLQYGYLVSYGAVTEQGDLAGHLAVLKEEPDAPVGELGLGMVDPRYRGHGIFQKLLPPVIERVTEMGMVGLFAETVTVHTITQKGKHVVGWRETGVVLGYIGDRTFKAIEGGDPHERQAIILFYVTLNPCPEQTVYVPEHHREMVKKIYRENGLEREFGENGPPPTSKGQVEVEAHPERGTASINVETWGSDTLKQIEHHLKDLCVKRIDLVMLNLPMTSPATGASVPELEKMGFFFAGVVPNLVGVDVLRLQYLNNVKVNPEVIKTYSPFAAELLQYVLKGANL